MYAVCIWTQQPTNKLLRVMHIYKYKFFILFLYRKANFRATFWRWQKKMPAICYYIGCANLAFFVFFCVEEGLEKSIHGKGMAGGEQMRGGKIGWGICDGSCIKCFDFLWWCGALDPRIKISLGDTDIAILHTYFIEFSMIKVMKKGMEPVWEQPNTLILLVHNVYVE